MKLLKICDARNIYETRTIGNLGIPFIGYHLISENDFSRSDSIKRCMTELRMYYPNTKGILVTKEQNIDRLTSLIREIEFDGVQLHYSDSNLQTSILRSQFGKSFLIFQVVTPEENINTYKENDFLIFDSSYIGGTGRSVSEIDIVNRIVDICKRKVLLAGGISYKRIPSYENFPFWGYDIQSSVKSDKSTAYENIDFNMLTQTAEILGYRHSQSPGKLGFAVLDIEQRNYDLFIDALNAGVDFLHLDVSDGFVGPCTDITVVNYLLKQIKSTNSHIPLQIHIFAASELQYDRIIRQLMIDRLDNVSIFTHLNQKNINNFSGKYITMSEVSFSLDVNDVLFANFPLEILLKKEILLCLSSESQQNRINNLYKSIEKIKKISLNNTMITIDRAVNSEVLTNLTFMKNVNFVCGSYLRKDMKNRYRKFKDLIYGI